MGRVSTVATVIVGMVMASAVSAEPMDPMDREVAQVEAEAQLRDAIEEARTSDPELALVLEDQLAQVQRGGIDAVQSDEMDLSLGVDSEMFADAGFSGPMGAMTGDPLLDSLDQDPRMAQLREQYDGGELSEDQARDKLFALMREHGVDPEVDMSADRLMEHFLGEPDSDLSIDMADVDALQGEADESVPDEPPMPDELMMEPELDSEPVLGRSQP
jgi:hypothetical protein